MNPPLLIPFPIANKYQLARQYTLEFNYHGDTIELNFPSGWLFNGASIPRAFWTTTGSPYLPKFVIPALAHDRLYEVGKYGRKECDLMFRYLLKSNDVGCYTRNKMYWGVRVGGGKAWKRCRTRKA